MSSEPRRPGGAVLLIMRIVSALELISLAVIVANRLTVHSPAIASSGGPVHGVLYISTIVFALLLPFPRSAKWLAVIPGIGGLLALWQSRRLASRTVAVQRATAPQPFDLTDSERENSAVVVDAVSVRLSKATLIGPLTFSAPRGKITGLIGPNGAGKTTVLRTISNLVSPTEGAVRFADDLTSSGRLGVLIEAPGFLPSLTARANLTVLTQLAGWPAELVTEALHRVGLDDSADARVGTFSLGMKQRLGLAAALLGRPPVLILDEPTNGLDPHGIADLRVFLRELADEGTTIIVSSHALDEIHEVSDHLVAIDAGAVIFAGSSEDMISTQRAGIRCSTTSSEDLIVVAEALTRAGYALLHQTDRSVVVDAGSDAGERLNELAFREGVTLRELAPQHPTLEEVFLAITGPGRDHPVTPNGAPA